MKAGGSDIRFEPNQFVSLSNSQFDHCGIEKGDATFAWRSFDRHERRGGRLRQPLEPGFDLAWNRKPAIEMYDPEL